jgi:hypothetical protein
VVVRFQTCHYSFFAQVIFQIGCSDSAQDQLQTPILPSSPISASQVPGITGIYITTPTLGDRYTSTMCKQFLFKRYKNIRIKSKVSNRYVLHPSVLLAEVNTSIALLRSNLPLSFQPCMGEIKREKI